MYLIFAILSLIFGVCMFVNFIYNTNKIKHYVTYGIVATFLTAILPFTLLSAI